MPEIAEVETVRRTLKNIILNKKIKEVKVLFSGVIEGDLNEFKTNLIGQTFKDIKRRGKWLIFVLDNYYLLSHLKMEGKYFVKTCKSAVNIHEHVILRFDDDTDLRYHDTRKFGKMILVRKEDIGSVDVLNKQGIEANSELLSKEYLWEKIKNKNIPIKTLLLDQSIISGLGNIYACEVLFKSKINPYQKGCNLNDDELERIATFSREVTNKAIEMGGTTIKSYTSSLGVTGRFQQCLNVYKRENLPCRICNEKIVQEKIRGRSTYYCPKCQVLKSNC